MSLVTRFWLTEPDLELVADDVSIRVVPVESVVDKIFAEAVELTVVESKTFGRKMIKMQCTIEISG